jgi:hypothetical protein
MCGCVGQGNRSISLPYSCRVLEWSPFVGGCEWLGGVVGSVGRLWSVTLAGWLRASVGKPPRAGGFPPNTPSRTWSGPHQPYPDRSTTTRPAAVTAANARTPRPERKAVSGVPTRKSPARTRPSGAPVRTITPSRNPTPGHILTRTAGPSRTATPPRTKARTANPRAGSHPRLTNAPTRAERNPGPHPNRRTEPKRNPRPTHTRTAGPNRNATPAYPSPNRWTEPKGEPEDQPDQPPNIPSLPVTRAGTDQPADQDQPARPTGTPTTSPAEPPGEGSPGHRARARIDENCSMPRSLRKNAAARPAAWRRQRTTPAPGREHGSGAPPDLRPTRPRPPDRHRLTTIAGPGCRTGDRRMRAA